MKLVFFIGQMGVYRYLSTVLNEAIKKEHQVEIVHQVYNVKCDAIVNSPFYGIDSNNLFFNEISSEDDLCSFLEKKEGTDFFLSIHPVYFPLSPLAKKIVNNRWCIVQHGFDSFAELWHWKNLGFKGEVNQNYNRFFFVHTTFFYNHGLFFLKKFSDSSQGNNYLFLESNRTSIVPVGSTMFSGEPRVVNEETIRKKYNIPDGKKIIIYLPFPFYPPRAKYSKKGNYAWQAAFSGLFLKYEAKGDSILIEFKNLLIYFVKKIIYLIKIFGNFEAITWLFKKWNEPRVLKEVKKFCDKNDLILICKSREKFPLVEQVYKSCFSIVKDDNQYCPSKLQELFSIADLVIGYQSTTVLESILNNTPYLNIELPGSILNNEEARLFFHNSNEGSMYKFRGVVNSMKIPELIANLNKMILSDFSLNYERKSKYMASYLGSEGQKSSNNLINYLEEKHK